MRKKCFYGNQARLCVDPSIDLQVSNLRTLILCRNCCIRPDEDGEHTLGWERCVPSVSSRAYGGTSIPSRFTCPDPKKRDYSPWEGLTSRASSPPPFGVILSRPRWQQRSCAPSGATVCRRRRSSIHHR
ncbi:hypothetical protein TNIN_264721 [Trichonephila inaurata madagascariensis]|uniref:Uncharacterized protein n=1 Tax=Trichonephila inaurata madagascariensis TaxID=2747483 RepID=A0A8X6WXU5_9ARAC|nr:hypothetical protein TNIN_264721 [Trichonephila inaurata madagascariensis]